MKFLYLLADVLCFFLFKVFGYRKKIILMNLRNSFPSKSEKEINNIADKFYLHFCDLVVETIKTLSITESEVKKMIRFEDVNVLKKYKEANQSIILMLGHLGNWELAGARFGLENLHQLYVIYHPLENLYFDKLVYKMRTRLGNRLYAMNEVLRGMIQNKADTTAIAFIADQTPPPETAYWMEFLHQDTPVFNGIGKLAKKFKYPIVYVSIKEEIRGKYVIHLENFIPFPANLHENEITHQVNKRLEADIVSQPEHWLWSHRRWKHKRTKSVEND
jgi:KDO2-lipid IV(A) lauroyltransferase